MLLPPEITGITTQAGHAEQENRQYLSPPVHLNTTEVSPSSAVSGFYGTNFNR